MDSILLTLKFFWKYASRYPKYFALSTLVIPQVMLMAIITPLLVGLGVSKLGDASSVSLSFKIILLLIVASITTAVIFSRIAQSALDRLEAKTQIDIYGDISEHILKESYEFHSKSYGGALIAQATKLGASHLQFMDSTMGEFLRSIVVLMASCITLSFFDTGLAIVMFSVTVIGVIIVFSMTRKRYPLQKEATAKASKHIAHLSDIISNVITVKTFAAETREKEHYKLLVRDTADSFLKSWSKQLNSNNMTLFMVGLMYVSILSYGYYAINKGIISSAIFITAQLYAVRLTAIFWDSSRMIRSYEMIFANSYEMINIMQNTPTVLDQNNAQELKVSSGRLELQDVKFSYSDANEPVIDGFSLNINPGQKVGLVGKSGGGKSTITKLLLRFMDIQSGSIKIDDQDISEVTQQSLRSQIAYVPQEPMLFHRSIKENIAYGKTDATDEEIHKAAKLAYAHEFIEKLPNKYDTQVGERGVKLSGGQKQRIAIARAMLKDAPILVLDEATSALDSESENLIQKALGTLMKNRTTIVIAHRLSTIQNMDIIAVVDNGKITEEGSHDKLLKKKGIYAKLWAHQSGGFIEE